VYGFVKEVAVVRYDHYPSFELLDEREEPGPRFEVEIVGRLVQKEDVWLCKEYLCQRYAHLPASGEFSTVALEILLRKTEPEECLGDVLFAGVVATCEDKLLEFVVG